MVKTTPEIWKNTAAQQLCAVLCAITDPNDMRKLLRDVMTADEITEISTRLEAARLLADGTKYTEIATATGLSSRTIARISDWMQTGTGGYAAALGLINHHASTTRLGEA